MTDLERATALAAQAASLSGALTLLLWRQGLLPNDVADEFAEKLRDMARQFESGDADGPAAQLWTAANLLGRRPPADRA